MKSLDGESEAWEWDLVKGTARRIRTSDRDDLESELAIHLLRLKCQPPAGVRNWKAFLKKALHNKASNWIRDRQAREKKMIALDESKEQGSGETFALERFLQSPEPDHELQAAFAQVWAELDPELRVVWEVLVQENGNQAEVARRLGKHRNTLRLWIRRIQEVLKRHGFTARL